MVESAVIRERRDVVADYGLKLNSGDERLTPHRLRLHRHRRTTTVPEKRHAKICYFSPIQCLFTRPTQSN
ncbi:hypothetical protein AAVH_09528 [Aphelenchoides avenae]|nr:hypothetical protein AAVH_09528 [Aphelenchus avenae]